MRLSNELILSTSIFLFTRRRLCFQTEFVTPCQVSAHTLPSSFLTRRCLSFQTEFATPCQVSGHTLPSSFFNSTVLAVSEPDLLRTIRSPGVWRECSGPDRGPRCVRPPHLLGGAPEGNGAARARGHGQSTPERTGEYIFRPPHMLVALGRLNHLYSLHPTHL